MVASYIRFGVLSLALLLARPAFSELTFENWTVDNGLPRNSLLGLVKTGDGYLWMATAAGLLRFDGVRFQLFDRRKIPGLTSNSFVIFSLMEDSHGGLWAGTWDGGAVYYRNGVFRVFTENDGLPNNSVIRIDEDNEGTVWLYTHPGLCSYKNGKLTRIAPSPNSAFNHFLTTPTNFNVDGYLWGLWRLTNSGWERFAFGKWAPFPIDPAIRHADEVHFDWLAEDSRHRLWYRILSRPGDYYCLENGRLRIFHGIGRNEFICYEDSRGRLWTSDADGHAAVREHGTRREVPSFSTASGFMAVEDPQSGLWLATVDKGLFHLTEPLIRTQRIPGTLQMNAIQALAQDRGGNVWIGSIGLTRWVQGHFQRFSRHARSANGNWKNTITSLFVDRDESLWIGYSDGVAHFLDNRIREAAAPLSEIKTEVNVIHRDANGGLWFGCSNGGYLFDEHKLTLFDKNSGLGSDSIRAIENGAEGSLWFGTDSGLVWYRAGKFKRYKGRDGPSSERIGSLYFDADRVLWIGTLDGGLYRFKNDVFTSYSAVNGLSIAGVYAIAEDKLGYLWLSSRVGLQRVLKKNLNDVAAGRASRVYATTFGRADGLRDLNCSGGGTPKLVKRSDGTLWFTTLNGVAVVDPAKIPTQEEPPPVRIEESLLDGRVVSADSAISIPPGQHEMEISYAAITFVKPEQVQFRYRLQGLDDKWTDTGTRRAAYLTHLPPGDYTFEVQATDSNGHSSSQPARLAVRVWPRFYQTWWFLAACLTTAMGMTYLAWQRRVRQLQQARAAQQTFSRRLIESQEAERKRIAAELHDGLGQRLAIIRSLALMVLSRDGSDPQSSEQLRTISSEAGHAFSEVKEISHNLRPHQLDILGLTKAVEGNVRSVATTCPIHLTWEADNIDGVFPAESEINLYRIVQECLSNIVRHSQASEAKVTIRHTEAEIRITVRDNGRGFAPGSATDQERRSGLGLTNIAERARLLGGTAQITSELGVGTEVTVILPPGPRTADRAGAEASPQRAIFG